MIYIDYIKMVIKTTLQYKASFIMINIGNFLAYTGYFAVIFILFDRFGSLADWTLREVALCFGVTNMAFYLAVMLARGFDIFERLIREGTFDRLLLRPRGLILQIIGQDIHFFSFGRILQPFLVILYAVSLFDNWTWLKSAGVILMVFSGTVIFSGVIILGATVCFWTVKGLEFINIFTYGGREAASYPLPIFGKGLMRFFTFVLPYATFNYLPLQYITGRTDNPACLLYPVIGMLFIIPCLLVWRFGVRHYASTGS